ncbi:L-lactate permease [Nocardia halotolerans]|uniref:L-lactate permease n=1 Tax=Nocardia halotolerans TaxID=1755878 RepID=A0ABV8VJ23_9NOCA
MTAQLWIVAAPALVVVVGVLVLRRAAWQVAVAGMGAVTLLLVGLLGTRVLVEAVPGSFGAAVLLTADAGLVIVPGLLLNEIMKRTGAHAEIVGWIEGWPVSAGTAALILTTGFAPALESITGFGVSLLVTVPVLLQLLPRAKALTASLLSLTIMPWGTAGLATTVAADLSGLPVAEVGVRSALYSFAIFPIFAVLVACVVAAPAERRRVTTIGAGLGLLFSTTLLGMNAIALVPLAGVTAGVVTGVTGYLVLVGRRSMVTVGAPADHDVGGRAVPWRALGPFIAVVVSILVVRAVDAVTGWGSLVAVHVDRVSFEPLLSPGLALLVVALVAGSAVLDRSSVAGTALGSWQPLVALFGFAATAQLMNHSGAVGELAELVGRAGVTGFIVFVPLLAVLTGYLVGSNTGANALMVLAQHGIGAEFDAGAQAVALQNSGAGHALFASVPETLLVLAVAGSGTRQEETTLLRFGFKVLGVVLAVMFAGAAITVAV